VGVAVSPASENPANPNGLDFGLVNCGTTYTGGAQTVTVTNSGNVELHINNLAVDSTSYQLAIGSGPAGTVANPIVVPANGSAIIHVIPQAIPASGSQNQVTDVTDTARFTGHLTFTTNDPFDTAHSILLTMAPQGAIIDDLPAPPQATWNFTDTALGLRTIIGFGIKNSGNVGADVSFTPTTYPLVFDIAGADNNPVGPGNHVAIPACAQSPCVSTPFSGTFTPNANLPSGAWNDTATLRVTASAICRLPAANWGADAAHPTTPLTSPLNITLSGKEQFVVGS
jgi:hypothetical protein